VFYECAQVALRDAGRKLEEEDSSMVEAHCQVIQNVLAAGGLDKRTKLLLTNLIVLRQDSWIDFSALRS
jgi:hypothetical protein